MVLAVQSMVARTIDFRDPVIVTVGTFHAGTKENVIPDEATFTGTVRSFSDEQRKQTHAALVRLVEGVASAHGLRVDVEWVPGYPPTVNDEREYELARDTLVDLFGVDRYVLEEHADPGVEDFAYVAEAVPSAYVSISACSAEDPAGAPDNHSPLAHFDDSVLPDCAAFLAEVAIRRLAADG
jgi:hippurate hydrolase